MGAQLSYPVLNMRLTFPRLEATVCEREKNSFTKDLTCWKPTAPRMPLETPATIGANEPVHSTGRNSVKPLQNAHFSQFVDQDDRVKMFTCDPMNVVRPCSRVGQNSSTRNEVVGAETVRRAECRPFTVEKPMCIDLHILCNTLAPQDPKNEITRLLCVCNQPTNHHFNNGIIERLPLVEQS
ncbi:hypothetical protein RE9431_17170 [Prescottella equi]|nr:hypothetical protein RE9431_17170 [Prescottella equi]BCN73114.1 hypothetical protein RE0327_17130 [Prescottella equi]